MAIDRLEKSKLLKMKKAHVLLVAMSLSVMAMSFTPKKSQKDVVRAERIQVKTVNLGITAEPSETAATPVVLVTVALAETSYAATVVATAAAVAWLFGSSEASTTPENYKALVQDIDLHSLDIKK